MPLFGSPNVEKLKSKGNIEGLIKAMDYEDLEVSLSAINALGNFSEAQAIKALINKLDTFIKTNFNPRKNEWYKSAEPGLAAAKALVKIGEPAIEFLVSAQRNSRVDINIREGATVTLGLIASPKVCEALMTTLEEEPNERILSWTKDVLYRIGDNQITDRLLALVEKEDLDQDGKIRKLFAIEVLGGISDKRSIQALINSLNEKSESFTQAAAKSLGEIGDLQAAEALVSYLRPGNRQGDRVKEALAKMGSPVMETIIAGLKNPNPEIRGGVASFLYNFGDARALPALKEALEDEDGHVRWWANKSLQSIEAKIRKTENKTG